MGALCKDVKLALNTHRTHLFPCLDRVHRSPGILVAMYEEHWGSLQVKVELGDEHSAVICAARCVVLFYAICKSISRVDANAPLHIARLLVEVVDGKIGLLHRRSDAH